MTISDELKKAIRASDESLPQIAAAVGISNPTLYRFLSDDPDQHRDIRLEATADRLAEHLRLTLAPKSPSPTPKKKRTAKRARKPKHR